MKFTGNDKGIRIAIAVLPVMFVALVRELRAEVDALKARE